MQCIIVDDESRNRDLLKMLLERNCPEVEILALASNGEEGIKLIEKLNPDLVFLDIEMPGMNGFEMLSLLPDSSFRVVFVTSHHHYAIKAIKFSAIDYLLKPIDVSELKAAVGKVLDAMETHQGSDSYAQFLHQVKNPQLDFTKIGIPTREGILFVEISDIIRCESDTNYTWFYMQDGSKILASKTLKEYETLLQEHLFYRVHKSHLINLKHLNRYVRGEGGSVIMSNGNEVEVSRRSKEGFLMKLKELQ